MPAEPTPADREAAEAWFHTENVGYPKDCYLAGVMAERRRLMRLIEARCPGISGKVLAEIFRRGPTPEPPAPPTGDADAP